MPRTRSSRTCPERALFVALALATLGGCRFDRGERWETVTSTGAETRCTPGAVRCTTGVERCRDDGLGFALVENCSGRGLVCAATLASCVACIPGETSCAGASVSRCADDGSGARVVETCDAGAGFGCRAGACTNLCADARKKRSNVGCEYWGVDLDNAMISAVSNAAAQQYAIVVSNPEADAPAHVVVEQDDALPGQPSTLSVAADLVVQPFSLAVVKLGPREVDGSPEGEFDTGTGTALTRHAYRVTSSVPVVAFQFNPLENVNVFSNDASLLKPVEALAMTPGTLETSYVVVGWPQTIASTDDPETNFNPASPIDLRAFLTIVGTRPGTRVRVKPTARVIPGGPVVETAAGGTIEATLEPFDVLNLETGGFGADFTGSTIEADEPVVVFSGSEASDAPTFPRLSLRRCCADHLEQQLDPVRTAGRSFVLAHDPSRTRAVVAAGARIGVVPEPQYFRVVAVSDAPTHLVTTLGGSDGAFTLTGRGTFRDLTLYGDATLDADEPVTVASIQPSQEAAGIARGLPGGDPSLVVVPPIEQWRASYVFLTPDKYAFDFVDVVAPSGATVLLDLAPIDATRCEAAPADGLTPAQRGRPDAPYVVYRCQLSYPTIDPDRAAPDNLTPGVQNDGVHRIESDRDVGVVVSGFDSFVSYGYAAGTKLEEINVH